MHRNVIRQRIILTPLIAQYDPRGNTGSSHHEYKAASIVFAEATPTIEQELINIIITERRRLQGISEFLVSKIAQHPIDVICIITGQSQNSTHQLSRTRITVAG